MRERRSPAELIRPLLIISVWVILAALGNVLVPQLERVVEQHARAFMPADAPSSTAVRQSALLFGESPGNNINYVVLERSTGLTGDDRRFYGDLVPRLHADSAQVTSVTDLWSDPVTAEAAVSADGRAAVVMIRLVGDLGTAEAGDAVRAVRTDVSTLGPPAGLDVYVTGPGATIGDEFAAIDRQMLMITGATVLLILVLLLILYRSPVTAAIPLLAVGVALAVARPIVAALGQAGVIEVSLFSVTLLAALMLGAGTDYGIFLIGRYHEARRQGTPRDSALGLARRGVGPVIVGSALTIAAALGALGFAKVGMLRSAGIPTAVGTLVVMVASLTLTPALLDLATRLGFAEPRPTNAIRRWRRVGTTVARWPGPVLVAAIGLVALLALPLAGMRVGWNEIDATPSGSESNRGYAAADRHFPANQILPTAVVVTADHSLRNPAGLLALERVSRALMAIPGVRSVQSASRPAGRVPDEATISHQAGVIGRQFGDAIDQLTGQLQRVGDLDATLSQLQDVVAGLPGQLGRGRGGFTEIESAAGDMQRGMADVQRTATELSGRLDPLRNFVAGTPDCPGNMLCAAVDQVVAPVDELLRGSAGLADSAARLRGGTQQAGGAFDGLPAALTTMRDALARARSSAREVTEVVGAMGPDMHQLSDYLGELGAQFSGSADGGFYLPQQALSDPRLRAAMDSLLSTDGRAAYLLVHGEGPEWGVDGAARSRLIETAVHEATKEGTLRPAAVYLGGVGPVTRDLQTLLARDMRLLVGTALVLIFAIMLVMLRSPVAALVVVGTVVVSFAAAVGASVLVWQYLLGHDLHWAVAPIALIALLAVGADYNLLLTLRLREETFVRAAGPRTGLIRAFGATGATVTAAGVVFGVTMAALAGSTVLSVAQIGTTIGIGLMIDTLVIRAFVVPSVAVLLGRWFWWPIPPVSPMRVATRRPGSNMLR